MRKSIFFTLFFQFIVYSSVSQAEILWQDNSLSLLHGKNFAVDAKEQTTLTFEHASGWNFGDLFMFMDLTEFHSSNQGDGLYGEFSPRLSFSKLTDQSIDAGPVKDVLLALSYEFGKGDVETFLLGPGIDLQLPGFDFLQLNLYRRFPAHHRDGEVFQFTPVWSMTTEFAGSNLIFDGFIDWSVSSDGNYEKSFHVNPQLKYDLSKALGFGSKKLLIGIEYSYWKNKYGIKSSPAFDTDQSVTSLLLKAHF